MQIITNKTIYRCDYCKKVYLIERYCKEHEFNCAKNPKNYMACSGCIFLKEDTITNYYEQYDHEYSKTSLHFHCENLNKDIYPYKCIRLGLVDKFPDSFSDQEVMPNKCEFHKYTE